MEIAWLEDFVALSSVGVFARAAEARNISQSAFTRRIKNLEYWIGTPLFDRSVHPVVLTPAGQAFKITAHEILNTLFNAREEVRGLVKREGEIVDFVALHTLAISFFPTWITEMERSLGPIKCRVQTENFSGNVEAILSGSSDFMLGYHHPAIPTMVDDARHPAIKVAEDRVIAVSAADPNGAAQFTLAGDARFPYLAYTPDSFLGRISSLIFERSGLMAKAEFRYENSVSEALKAACVQGLGVAWLPELAIRTELESGQLVRISETEHEAKVSIRLYRSMERSRSEIERLWAFASNR